MYRNCIISNSFQSIEMEMSKSLQLQNVGTQNNTLEFFKCTFCCQLALYDLYPNHAKKMWSKNLLIT